MLFSRLLPPALLVLVCAQPGCKVPLTNINAAFTIADVAWFAQEETLFAFYDLGAEQGLGHGSIIEIRYTTDDGVVPWTDVADLPRVHTHVPVDCGFDRLCGSTSIHVPLEPREVALRLRYHRDGQVTLDPTTVLNVVGPGPAHSHRSLLVYGVFGAHNRAIQWRARHRFPTIRNEEAQRLGLRRRFTIEAQRFGSAKLGGDGNPYAYGVSCPGGFMDLGLPTLDTGDRAVFNGRDISDTASSAAMVCARSTVYDPTGAFTTDAIAHKNPEVRPAFPLLRSPVRDAIPIKYLLSVCERSISSEHLEMQRQRLFLGGVSPICIDHWMDESFLELLGARFRDDVERVRAEGKDMVLVLALHHDSPDIRPVIEEALSTVLAPERRRRTPRVAGAFVLDSQTYRVTDPEAATTVIWCPAELPVDDLFPPDQGMAGASGDGGPDEGLDETRADGDFEGEGSGSGAFAGFGTDLDGLDGDEPEGEKPDFEFVEPVNFASLVCALGIDNPIIRLGPLRFNALPVFPSRSQFLDFIDTFSEAQAGRMESLTFRVPELPPSAEHVELAPGIIVTLLNDEVISAEVDDAFSFCETEEFGGVLFRSAILDQLLPIEVLAEFHRFLPEETYELGIVWDFPYLLRLEYEAVIAGAVTAFSASVPFGITTTTQQNFGSEIWVSETFSLAETLTQCLRFCDHPTFDAAGVYQVTALFRIAYGAACYAPRFPERGDSGFPHDP